MYLQTNCSMPQIITHGVKIWLTYFVVIVCVKHMSAIGPDNRPGQRNPIPTRNCTYRPCCIEDFKHTLLTVYFHLLGKKGKTHMQLKLKWARQEEYQLHFYFCVKSSVSKAATCTTIRGLIMPQARHLGQLTSAPGLLIIKV